MLRFALAAILLSSPALAAAKPLPPQRVATNHASWVVAFQIRPVWPGWTPLPVTPGSLAEAKALMRQEFDRWLAWAVQEAEPS